MRGIVGETKDSPGLKMNTSQYPSLGILEESQMAYVKVLQRD